MNSVYNFSAGPAMLPPPVLEIVQKELRNYGNSGMSIMEMSHRGPQFTEVLEQAIALFREVMQIPDNYKVLFLQGGASLQFTMVPLNFAGGTASKTGYIDTGVWSDKAIKEAQKLTQVEVLASSKDKNYNYIPQVDVSKAAGLDYLHLTTNNTIYGTRFPELPLPAGIPLIADMSSDILSRNYNVSDFGMIYAGAQKNIGPSGVVIAIIREDLLQRCNPALPSMLSYKTIADNNSLYNTPNTFGIYVCKLVLEWLKEMGGIPVMEAMNLKKAALLYDFLDNSALFSATVQPPYRSIMNVPFVTGNPNLDAQFIAEAESAGLTQLTGYRTVGGMRASIYNAMPIEGVEALVAFMKAFELTHKL